MKTNPFYACCGTFSDCRCAASSPRLLLVDLVALPFASFRYALLLTSFSKNNWRRGKILKHIIYCRLFYRERGRGSDGIDPCSPGTAAICGADPYRGNRRSGVAYLRGTGAYRPGT